MGGSSSMYFHIETPEEIQERSRIVRLQDQAFDYVKNVMYYGVSIRTGRKPSGKIDQIWVEPQPDLLEEALKNGDTANLDLINCAPSGVLIDTKGNVKILFTMSDVEYIMKSQDIADYVAAKRKINTVNSTMPTPSPPELEKATSTTLALRWDKMPFPVGIIQKVEVQYANLEGDLTTKSFKWSALTSKFYSAKYFSDYTLYQLQPGSHFRFRLRYFCDAGWSEFSDISLVFSTLPDRPSRPAAPECIAITSTAVELQWQEHTRDNGSPIISYILQGRSVGDRFVVLYEGMDLSHLELGIFPEYAYSFQLIVVNGLGESDPSTIVSVRTPQKPRERTPGLHKGFDMKQITLSVQCKDAWKECWDPKTEQVFYFNKILGTRQLNKPQVMIEMELAEAEDEEVTAERKKKEAAKKREAEFRKKRYRLLRALHKNKHQAMSAASARQSRGSLDNIAPMVSALVYDEFVLAVEGNGATSSGGAASGEGGGAGTGNLSPVASSHSSPSRTTPTSVTSSGTSGGGASLLNKPVFIDLRRELMLPDCIAAFSRMTLVDYFRRFKVTFAGEAGIDSGGLSKEAFLLLSKQAAVYAGPQVHKWMVPLKGVEKTADNIGAGVLEVEGFFFESNNAIKSFDAKREEANSKTSLLSNPNKVASTNALSSNAINVLDYEVGVTSEKFCQFLGKLIGKALFDRQLIDFPLSPLLLQHMLGGLPFESKVNSTGNIVNRSKTEEGLKALRSEVNQMLTDIKDIDEELYKSLHWIANNNIENIIYETFSVVDGDVTLPLCASGDTKDVTEDNKFEYIQLMILWKTKYSISNSLFPFLASFHEFIPVSILKECAISKQELNLILNGKSTVDVEELRAYCIYEADDLEEFNEQSNEIVWFWRMFRELADAERRVLLKFFTGSSRVPLDGYDPPLNITQGCNYMKDDSLPVAHTCFNQIVLPNYSSYQVCKEKIHFAMKNSEGFDLA